MFCHGARISEVLRLKGSDILPNQQMRLKGLKGSNDRIVSTSLFSHELLPFVNCASPVFFGIDRFYIYRIMRKANIGCSGHSKTKNRITHSLRANYINELFENMQDVDSVAQIIGHKNSNNTIIYLNKDNEKKLSESKRVRS
jgi:site-specific recombinase XerD